MTTCEQDQEHGNRWSGFLDFDSFFGPTSFCAHNNQSNGCIYHDQCLGEYHYGDRNFSYMENNELNQELAVHDFSRLAIEGATESLCGEEIQIHSSHPPAFSRLAIEGATESLCGEEIQIHSSHPPANWRTPYTNYWPAHDASDEVADNNEPSTSCSSPGERSYDGEDYSSYLELMDDSSIDGELGKRINQMIPVPHVPRINGEIPSVDEATSDHQRLLDRLQLYDLDERKVQGDGNCQFRALSDQFYRSPEHHKFVRQQVVSQLKANPEDYAGYVPMEYDEYLEKMSKVGEWGDHVTLQAAADSYGVKIFVITSFKDTCYIEILPKDEKSKRVIFLSFWAEVHYNSIYPHGESPPTEFSRKKKRWWQFRHKH